MTTGMRRRAHWAIARRRIGRNARFVPAILAVGMALGFSPAAPGQERRADDASTAVGDEGTRGPLEFIRVHVPTGRLADVPLGGDRYVPMSAREFEEGVARLAASGASRADRNAEPTFAPLATAARYVVGPAADGGLAGSLEFDVGWPDDDDAAAARRDAAVAREMPLPGLDVRSGVMRTAAGTGEAVVFGRRDGSIAMATPAVGTYGCRFRVPPSTALASPRLRLPLVPSLSSSVVLLLPRGIRPAWPTEDGGATAWEPLPGEAATHADASAADRVAWRIAAGPRSALEFVLVPGAGAVRPVTLWSDVAIQGRQARLEVLALPTTGWAAGPLRLEKDPEVLVTAVTCGPPAAAAPAAWSIDADGGGIVIELPPQLTGQREPVVIHAVAPLDTASGRVPAVRAPASAWRGGGTVIRVAPALSVAAVEPEHCLVVAPEAAAAWPLPAASATTSSTGGAAAADGATAERSRDRGPAAAWPARYWLEHQSARAAVSLTLEPRRPVLDVARVTTVDLSAGTVVARAACDIRVDRGEAFELSARVTGGWFVDSVEAVATPLAVDPGETARRREPAEPAAAIEWKLLRDGLGEVLRIGLTTGAAPGRGLVLRITGHRAGIPLETDFSTAEIDLVRFDGEAERSALLELRTSPETTVEFDGADPAAPGPEGRLAALAEDGPVRARAWAGYRSASRMARLVRRRPPLDARTQVRLTVRDDRLTESFMFDCRPAGSDLDSIVVQFAEPTDEPLDWSLLPPAVGSVSARRLDAADRRGGPAAGDRWLVEIAPAARGPVTIRAARTTVFTRRRPVPLVWVDGATSAVGEVIVRDVGRSRLKVVNHRLSELPPAPEAPAADAAASVAMEFSFDSRAAADDAEGPAAELVPWGGDARACAWREVVSSWCHASGETEHETLYEIDNHGRATVALEVRRGHRLEGVLLDGVRLALGEGAAAGGSVVVELPLARRLVRLLVRTVAERTGGAASRAGLAWKIDSAPVQLADVAVLQREWVLLLPPGFEVLRAGSTARLVTGAGDAAPRDWAARLLGAGVRRPPDAAGAAAALPASVGGNPPRQGFRQFVVVPEGGGSAVVTVVAAEVLIGAAVVAAVAWAAVVLALVRLRPRAAVLAVAIAGVAALWAEPPLDGILRAAWWSGLATWLVASWVRAAAGRGGPASAAAAIGLAMAAGLCAWPAVAQDVAAGDRPPAAVANGGGALPLRVFILPITGGDEPAASTALVPELIFRLLVRGNEPLPAAAAVRVLATRVTAAAAGDGDAWGAFRLAIDIDADTGGTLWLDQSASGGRFVADDARIDGAAAPCRLDDDGRVLRMTVIDAGRHTIDVGLAPAVDRRGEVESAALSLPVAPRGTLRLTDGTTGLSGTLCERAATDGGFLPVAEVTTDAGETIFDVSGAARLRLVRPLVGGRLAEIPRSVASRNDIFWNLDECRLTATYVVEPGDAILRGVVVRVDDGLEWIPPVDRGDADPGRRGGPPGSVAIRPLGGGRFAVEFASPDRAATRFEMAFRMPLSAPVGVFDVPGAWLERAAADVRSVRLAASPALTMRVELPPGLTTVAAADGDASFETRAWRGEVSRSGTAADAASRPGPVVDAPAAEPRVRLITERRQQALRGPLQQRQSVVFAAEQIRLHLDARLDAAALPLVTLPLDVPAGCVIDRVVLSEEDAVQADAADRSAIDVRLARPSDSRALLVIQRPRAGRFRLEVDARLPGRPPAHAPLPRLRVAFADASRARIDWRTEDGQQVAITAGGETAPAATAGQLELAADESTAAYALEPAAARPPDDRPDVAEPAAGPAGGPREERVELADVRLAVDARGGMWGIACFEMVASEKTLTLRLPGAWRLFDVSVDGKPVAGLAPAATPPDRSDRVGDTFWEVRLLDAGWPRSIVALFKGELGQRVVGGEPLELVPPSIVGLPARKVIWTLKLPPGVSPRIAPPAHLVAGDSIAAERRAARQRLDEDFEGALDRAAGTDRVRLRAFLRARREGTMPVADEAWSRTLAAAAPLRMASPRSVVVDGAEADSAAVPLAVRLAWDSDATLKGRAIATAALLAGVVLVRLAARRRAAWLARAAELLPLAALPVGLAWMAWLVPVWPGAAILAAGGIAIVSGWLAWLRPAVGHGRRPPARVGDGDIAIATTQFAPTKRAGG